MLWLYGPEEEITEVGAMNIFALFQHSNGQKELVTPNLESGLILPGVTRRSVLELAREWSSSHDGNELQVSERKLTMKEVLNGAEDGTLLEMFGTGTAAIISPVGNILYDGKMRALPADHSFSNKVRSTLSDIYYGKIQHPWGMLIEDWSCIQDQVELKRIEDYKKCFEARI